MNSKHIIQKKSDIRASSYARQYEEEEKYKRQTRRWFILEYISRVKIICSCVVQCCIDPGIRGCIFSHTNTHTQRTSTFVQCKTMASDAILYPFVVFSETAAAATPFSPTAHGNNKYKWFHNTFVWKQQSRQTSSTSSRRNHHPEKKMYATLRHSDA